MAVVVNDSEILVDYVKKGLMNFGLSLIGSDG